MCVFFFFFAVCGIMFIPFQGLTVHVPELSQESVNMLAFACRMRLWYIGGNQQNCDSTKKGYPI